MPTEDDAPAVTGGEFERDLTFTIKFDLAYSKNWPGRAKSPSIDELACLAGDILKRLRRSNYRIAQGPPVETGSWPPVEKGQR